MGKSKDVRRYAVEWLQLADKIQRGLTEPHIVRLETNKKARVFRSDFYAFRDALEASGMKQDYPEIDHVELQLHGNEIHIITKEMSDSAIAIRESLK